MSDEMITFLRAQLDEDERIARKNTGDAGLGDDGSFPDYRTYDGSDLQAADEFLHHFTSQRVLAHVAAKRQIIDKIAPWIEELDRAELRRVRSYVGLAPKLLRLLALPYVDHPDYLEEWKP